MIFTKSMKKGYICIMKTESIVMIIFSILVIACLSLRFTHDKKVKYIEIKCDSICDTIIT